MLRPIGLSLVLVCARYDEFQVLFCNRIISIYCSINQNMDSERKRQTYSFIRLFAHINGASIIVSIPSKIQYILGTLLIQTLSMRMDSLVQKTLALLASLAFGNAPPRAFNVDHQQPLFVAPHGADSLEVSFWATDIHPTHQNSSENRPFPGFTITCAWILQRGNVPSPSCSERSVPAKKGSRWG